VTTDTTLKEIIAEQEEIFVRRQPQSARLAAQARQYLTGGVTSSWQITAPQPVWLSRGRGSKVWDVDGNEYVDLHGGYGAALAGHAHPAIQEAIASQARNGTHFAQPTPDAVTVAAGLAERFGLPRWRFANSGTEATMDAVHLMRSITGRDLIIKIEGCYHGHHDSVQVSVAPDGQDAGPGHKPHSAPSSSGLATPITDFQRQHRRNVETGCRGGTEGGEVTAEECCIAPRCRVEPFLDQGGALRAPLARRQRRALPWEARPAHVGHMRKGGADQRSSYACADPRSSAQPSSS